MKKDIDCLECDAMLTTSMRCGSASLCMGVSTISFRLLAEEGRTIEPKHELHALPCIDTSVHQKLTQQWINTAEELLSVASNPQGLKGLLCLLSLTEADFDVLLTHVKEVVGENESARIMSAAQPGGSLGARLTEEQKERLGVDLDETGSIES